ncbi:MAG TPA: hypothetical protein VLT59_15725 [Steroidobacteraceae bacterium]|nr:hypothetical protein [Steroidobacteraceae bacterium]
MQADRTRRWTQVVAGLAVWGLVALPAAATEPICEPEQALAFEFWIGDWQIEQRILRQDGTWIELPARTTVTRVLDGRALLERWQGEVEFFWFGMTAPAPMTGFSYRACDPQTNRWSIYWADSLTPGIAAPYVGSFAAGRGEFFRDSPAEGRLSRISFSDIAPDSVFWALAISSDEGRTWTDVWTMKMRRSVSPATAPDSER